MDQNSTNNIKIGLEYTQIDEIDLKFAYILKST